MPKKKNINIQKHLDFNFSARKKKIWSRLKQTDFDGKYEYSWLVSILTKMNTLIIGLLILGAIGIAGIIWTYTTKSLRDPETKPE